MKLITLYCGEERSFLDRDRKISPYLTFPYLVWYIKSGEMLPVEGPHSEWLALPSYSYTYCLAKSARRVFWVSAYTAREIDTRNGMVKNIKESVVLAAGVFFSFLRSVSLSYATGEPKGTRKTRMKGTCCGIHLRAPKSLESSHVILNTQPSSDHPCINSRQAWFACRADLSFELIVLIKNPRIPS